MQSDVSDPDHESPDHASGDVWEDAGNFQESPMAYGTALPPKRLPAEEAPSSQSDDGEEIKIMPGTQAKQTNDNDASLDVRTIAGDVLRLQPEEPTQPKVPRHVVFHEQPAKPERETDDASWGEAKKFPVKWIAIIGAGVLAVIILTIYLLDLLTRPDSPTTAQLSSALTTDGWNDPNALGTFEEMSTRADEAAQIFRKFKTASVVDDFLPFIRDHKTLEPIIRKNHDLTPISKNWNPAQNAKWEVLKNKKLSFGLLGGTLPDYSDFDAYFVLVNHDLLMDWKASTGFSTATFDELSQNQGNPAEIRTTILPATYYSPVFPEKEFQSYKIIAPDNVRIVWCYTRLNDHAEAMLSKIFRAGGILEPARNPHKVTLRLEHGPKGASPNQWVIAEVLNDEWISP